MAYLSTRMILCHMAKQPFGDAELWHPVLPQLLDVANTYGRQAPIDLPRRVALRCVRACEVDASLPRGGERKRRTGR